MHSLLSRVIALSLFLILSILLIVNAPDAKAALATTVVISEVSISGGTASDEFVELYNPTSNDIVLDGWRLSRKTSTGSESNLISSLSGTIKSHGYLLITPQTGYLGMVAGDKTYSVADAPLASNNTVLLYSDAGITLIDKVGFGTAVDREGTASANPLVGEGLERKANSTSTFASMTSGVDVSMGNGEDTNNNLSDFIMRVVAQPQNSSSDIEPLPATPTETTSPTATLTVTVTPTATPTATETPTPSPTSTPSPTVTVTPTLTTTPSPTVTTSPTATPTPIFTIPNYKLVCTNKILTIKVLSMVFNFSVPTCNLITL